MLFKLDKHVSVSFEYLDIDSKYEIEFIEFLCKKKVEVDRVALTIKNSKIKANLILDLFEKIKQEKKLYKLVL